MMVIPETHCAPEIDIYIFISINLTCSKNRKIFLVSTVGFIKFICFILKLSCLSRFGVYHFVVFPPLSYVDEGSLI